jgi:hypothetical protein
LRSDKGGEYTSNEFQEFCVKQGMERQLTVPYSPQQNGVAERRNKIICEMANSMLIDKEMSVIFWAEAVSQLCIFRTDVTQHQLWEKLHLKP